MEQKGRRKNDEKEAGQQRKEGIGLSLRILKLLKKGRKTWVFNR